MKHLLLAILSVALVLLFGTCESDRIPLIHTITITLYYRSSDELACDPTNTVILKGGAFLGVKKGDSIVTLGESGLCKHVWTFEDVPDVGNYTIEFPDRSETVWSVSRAEFEKNNWGAAFCDYC